MAQLRNLGTPFGSPGGIINIPAPAGSALAGQIQMRAMSGLGQALGMYLGQRQQTGYTQENLRRIQAMGPQQDIFNTMYGARGLEAPQAQMPQMVGPRAQEAQLGGYLQRLFGDPFGVQRTKATLQTAQAQAALGTIPSGQQTSATGLRKEFRSAPTYKKYQTTQRAEQVMEKALEFSKEPGLKSRIASDQALGVLFQKVLDPESVVRESEYARTPEGASILSRIRAIPQHILRGGLALTDEDREALLRIAKEVVNADKRAVNKLIDDYTYTAEQYGVNPKWVIGNMTKFDLSPDEDTSVFVTSPFTQGREGQTATNPKTGERLIFRNGQWQPFEDE